MGSTTYATYGQRVLAVLVDVLILIIPILILQMVVGRMLGTLSYVGGVAGSLVLGGLVAGYNYYFLTTHGGQTIGKKTMKIKVVAESGGVLTPDVVIKREVVAKLLPSVVSSLVPVLGGLVALVYFLAAYLWPLWDPKKQTLMDRFAGTVVVPV